MRLIIVWFQFKIISQERKKPRLAKQDVSAFIVDHNLKTATEVYAFAEDRKEAGEHDLSNFILNQGEPKVLQLLSDTWKMKEARAKLLRQSKTRIQLLEEAAEGDCVPGAPSNGNTFSKLVCRFFSLLGNVKFDFLCDSSFIFSP